MQRDDIDIFSSRHQSRNLAEAVASSSTNRPVITLPLDDSRLVTKYGTQLVSILECARCSKPVSPALLPCLCVGSRTANCKFIFKDELVGWAIYLYIRRRAKSDYDRENRAGHLEQTPGWHSRSDVDYLYTLQRGQCYFCGVVISRSAPGKYEIDHLEPVSRKGSNWPDNLALVCRQCNNRKGNSTEAAYWCVVSLAIGKSRVRTLRERATKNRPLKRLRRVPYQRASKPKSVD